MEFKSHEWRDDVFAAAAPLEALKYMLSIAVCWLLDDIIVVTDEDDVVIALLDVSRAHFHSPPRRKVYVDLCEEDSVEGMCALLLKSMYGTRDAASNWEGFYTAVMVKGGFRSGSYSPCLFWHPIRKIRV